MGKRKNDGQGPEKEVESPETSSEESSSEDVCIPLLVTIEC